MSIEFWTEQAIMDKKNISMRINYEVQNYKKKLYNAVLFKVQMLQCRCGTSSAHSIDVTMTTKRNEIHGGPINIYIHNAGK